MSIAGPILGIIASVAGGIGTAMMEKSRMKAQEQAKIDEEKRAEERYTGIGDAAAFWEKIDTQADASIAAPSIEPHKSGSTPLGQPEKPQQMGAKYNKHQPKNRIPAGFNGAARA